MLTSLIFINLTFVQNSKKRSHQMWVSIESEFLIFWKHEFRSSSDMEKSIRTSGQPSWLGTRHTTTVNEAGCEFANIKPLLHRKPCMLCLWSEELFYSLTSLSMLHTVHDVFYTYIIQNRVYLFRKMYIKYWNSREMKKHYIYFEIHFMIN